MWTEMTYIALLTMVDPVGSQRLRPLHLAYLDGLRQAGKVLMAGPFVDGDGGMVMYDVESLEEAKRLASEDPLVKAGVRSLELRAWAPLW